MRATFVLLVVSLLLTSFNLCLAQRQYPLLTFLAPSTFPHLSSIAVDSTDYVYVLNFTTIVECNAPRSVVWTIDLSHALVRPVAIKVDDGGRIFVTDEYRRAVWVFDSDGDVLDEYTGMKGAASDGTPITPAGLAFDRAGTLYVVDNSNSRVVMFDQYGNVTGYVRVPEGGSRQRLVDIVVDVWGRVYVSDVGEARVVVLNAQNNTLVAEWFADFVHPMGLAIDSSNFIYVADVSTNITHAFNLHGQLMWQQAWQSYQLSPNWLAVNGAGQLFVGDKAHNTVGIISGLVLPGTVLSTLTGQIAPVAVAVTNTSLLLIVNSLPSNIEAVQLYSSNYDMYVYQLTKVNATQPAGLAVSNVASGMACQSDVWTSVVNCYLLNGYYSGRLVLSFQPAYYYTPGAIAIDDVQLLIYVLTSAAGFHSYTIQVFSFTGHLVKVLDFGLNQPSAVAVSPLNANVFIADTANGRIVVANRQGSLLHTYTGFQQPVGVAVDGNNNVYVIDGDGKVIILDRHGRRLYTIEHGFSGARSIAVDKLGRIIVADTNNNRVVVMQGLNTPLQVQAEGQQEQTKGAQLRGNELKELWWRPKGRSAQ